MERSSHNQSHGSSQHRRTDSVAPLRTSSDLSGDRNRLSHRNEADEQGFSGSRRHLSIDGALHKGWRDPLVQYYFRLSGRGSEGTTGNGQLHDGYLQEVSGRGVLD